MFTVSVTVDFWFLHFKQHRYKNSPKKTLPLHNRDDTEFWTFCGKRQNTVFRVDDVYLKQSSFICDRKSTEPGLKYSLSLQHASKISVFLTRPKPS